MRCGVLMMFLWIRWVRVCIDFLRKLYGVMVSRRFCFVVRVINFFVLVGFSESGFLE